MAYVQTHFNCVTQEIVRPDKPIPFPDLNLPTPDPDSNDDLPDKDGPYDERERKPIWWYHSDHLGSSTYLTDNFGRPSHYYETLPFGEMIVEHNQSSYYKDPYPTTNTGSYDNAWKFNGKELDDATGMYYYGARYYDPRISIFVSVDPLVEETMTPYQYVSNNPIMRIDPTGMNDYSINRETGQMDLIRETKDDFDRVMNTNKTGKVRIKGEGFLGFLVSKSEQGKEKVLLDNIPQGILKDGINFKNDYNVVPVNGVNSDDSSQPSDSDFQDFIQRYSGMVGVEVSGYGLGNSKNSDIVSAYLVEPHKENKHDKSYSMRLNKNISVPSDYLGGYDGRSTITKLHYHTHPDDYGPSPDDKIYAGKKNVLHYIYGKSTNTQYDQNGVINNTKRVR